MSTIVNLEIDEIGGLWESMSNDFPEEFESFTGDKGELIKGYFVSEFFLSFIKLSDFLTSLQMYTIIGDIPEYKGKRKVTISF